MGQIVSQYPQPLPSRRCGQRAGELRHRGFGRRLCIGFPSAAPHFVSMPNLRHLWAMHFCASAMPPYWVIEQLHQANERYRLIIEEGSTDRALITVDRTGGVTSWNPGAERLLGYTQSEIMGKHFAIFFTPEDIRSGLPARELRQVERDGRIEQEGWCVLEGRSRIIIGAKQTTGPGRRRQRSNMES